MILTNKKRMVLCEDHINDMVQTILHSRKEITVEQMQEEYLKETYPQDHVALSAKRYALDLSRTPAFIAWPVFFGSSFENINICAVNFGALSLSGKNGIDAGAAAYLNAALNTLVITSLQKEVDGKILRYWPTNLDFTNKVESGTINQCTLTLSTLNRLGFLDRHPALSAAPLTPEERSARFSFVIECLRWVLSLRSDFALLGSAWSYSDRCRDAQNSDPIETAILPSQFAYECIARYRRLFLSEKQDEALVEQLAPGLLQEMKYVCEQYEVWSSKNQRKEGGYRRNSNETVSSFPFSCCAMMTHVYSDAPNQESLKKLMHYLVRHHKNFNFSDQEIVERYQYEYEVMGKLGHVNDAYEVFAESLFITNACKNIDRGAFDSLSRSERRRIRQVNYIAYRSILSRITRLGASGMTVVKGRQPVPERFYPIYTLYYSRLCLERLLQNDRLPRAERKEYISYPLPINWKTILLCLCLALCLFWALRFSMLDTIYSLVLSLVTFLIPTIISLFRGPKDQ